MYLRLQMRLPHKKSIIKRLLLALLIKLRPKVTKRLIVNKLRLKWIWHHPRINRNQNMPRRQAAPWWLQLACQYRAPVIIKLKVHPIFFKWAYQRKQAPICCKKRYQRLKLRHNRKKLARILPLHSLLLANLSRSHRLSAKLCNLI